MDGEHMHSAESETHRFDPEALNREGALTDDFVSFLFETPNPTWEAFADRYSDEGVDFRRVSQLKAALVRYVAHEEEVNASDASLRATLHELDKEETTETLGRMCFANAVHKLPIGRVHYEKREGSIILTIENDDDWRNVHEAFRDAEKLPMGAAVNLITRFGTEESEHTFPILFADIRKTADRRALEQLVAHERQHLVFNSVFARYEAARGTQWESATAVADEILAYMRDGSPLERIVAHIRKDYAEDIEKVPEQDRMEFSIFLQRIETSMALIANADYTKIGIDMGRRYAAILVTHPIESFAEILDGMRAFDEKRFSK